MFKPFKTYDLIELARSNLHVHTTNSSCAKRENTVKNILKKAAQDGITTLAFTDHYNSTDFHVMDCNQELARQAQETGTDIQILYGSELSAYGIGKFLDSIELNRMLDYRLYAYNHFHVGYWHQPEDKSPRGYVEHSIKVLESLFATDRADCVAHPFVGRYIPYIEDKSLVPNEITDQELGDILEKGMKSQVAWEINTNVIFDDPEFSRRYWDIGKEVGVTFTLGTDTHSLDTVATSQYLDRLKRLFS